MAHPEKVGIYLGNKVKPLKGFKQGGEGEGQRVRERAQVHESEGGGMREQAPMRS